MDPTIAVAIVSATAVIIAAFIKFVPAKATPAPPPTNGNRSVTQSECEARMETHGSRIDAVGEKVDTLKGEMVTGFNDVKALIREKNK